MKNRVKKYEEVGLINPIKRVYLAGAMSSTDPLQFLTNLARGIYMSAVLIKSGYAVFSPFIDFQLFLTYRDKETQITLEQIQTASLAWLTCSDAMLVLSGYEKSRGTLKEILLAQNYGIPIYYSFDELERNKK